jgi:transcriptional regulator with XRE-family HTH domain|tara:strand:+ start:1011 stop:1196 length:186 start_codon:yes stop_codon:yes gene_type:complete
MILDTIMQKKKISKSQIARDLDISEAMVTLLFQGKRSLSVKLIKKIKDTYNLSYTKIMEEV